jgi:hypothetical protein
LEFSGRKDVVCDWIYVNGYWSSVEERTWCVTGNTLMVIGVQWKMTGYTLMVIGVQWKKGRGV